MTNDEERAWFADVQDANGVLAKMVHAQAAVIERVRRLCRDPERRSTRDPNAVSIVAVRWALAALPEPTESDENRYESTTYRGHGRRLVDWLRAENNSDNRALRAKLSAANAKVAELEAALHHGDDVDAEMRDKLSAANARADAAEQRRLVYQRLCDEREQALQRAESEAASLRAEVERYRSALAELGIELVDDE